MSVVSPAPVLHAAQNYYIKPSKKKKKVWSSMFDVFGRLYLFWHCIISIGGVNGKASNSVPVVSIMDLWDDLHS